MDRRAASAASSPPTRWSPCIGTKELVASLPRVLSLRDPSRDTVLYPAVAYPTYEMGALLGGLRPVPVPVDDGWHLDLARVDPADAARALVLWLNDPEQPHRGHRATPARMRDAVEWARARGVVVASDECYAEFTYDADGAADRARHRARRGHRRRARGALAVEALEHGRAALGLRRRRPGAGRLPRRGAQARRAHDAGAGAGRHGGRARRRRARRRAARPLRAPARRRCSRRSRRAGWCTTAARPPSTSGCATPTGPVTAGPSPTTSPPPAWWSRPATSTATRAPTTCASR